MAQEFLQQMAFPVLLSDREQLIKAVNTALSSKVCILTSSSVFALLWNDVIL
jgi:hypothetical protein